MERGGQASSQDTKSLTCERYFPSTCDGTSISLLAAGLGVSSIRQLAINCFGSKFTRSSSWSIFAQKILSKYPFYSPGECLSKDLDPALWASYMKTCIEETWERPRSRVRHIPQPMLSLLPRQTLQKKP